MDGGLLANNPTAIMLHEARCLFPGRPLGCILSIGTGLEASEELGKGAAAGSWSAVIGALATVTARTDLVDDALKDVVPENVYYRVNPVLTFTTDLNEHRQAKLEQLQEDARSYIRSPEMETLITSLCNRINAVGDVPSKSPLESILPNFHIPPRMAMRPSPLSRL